MRKLIVAVLMVILLLTGCNNITTSNSNDNSLEGKLKGYIESKTTEVKVDKVKVVSSNIIDHGMLLFVLFDSNTKNYEGLFQIKQEKESDIPEILYGDYTIIDKKSSFTVHQMGGDAALPGEQKKTYLFVGGVVNSDDIKSLNIKYNDGQLVHVIVENSRTYNFARTDKAVSIKSIDALDKDDNIIYNYPPYPAKKAL